MSPEWSAHLDAPVIEVLVSGVPGRLGVGGAGHRHPGQPHQVAANWGGMTLN